MGEIRDMMETFELYQPMELSGALDLLRRHGNDAWVFSGGMDTFDWLKDRTKNPPVVVDVGGIQELHGVEATADGIRIGAMTTLAQVVAHSEVNARFPLLAHAANRVATPQIRHQGTIGGNVSQDARCWYYRSGFPCYRAGGNTCYANAPDALNREHAIFEANRCVAVSPSDTAPALVALDAQMEVHSARGSRMVNAENFFIGPATDIRRMNVMEPSELLTAIHIPNRWAGAASYFEKVADRGSWDFPLVNVAANLDIQNGTIYEARVVVGAVAARPLRLRRVENAIAGRPVNDDTLEEAGRLTVQNARPLQFNGYKIALARNLVRRAIREATA